MSSRTAEVSAACSRCASMRPLRLARRRVLDAERLEFTCQACGAFVRLADEGELCVRWLLEDEAPRAPAVPQAVAPGAQGVLFADGGAA